MDVSAKLIWACIEDESTNQYLRSFVINTCIKKKWGVRYSQINKHGGLSPTSYMYFKHKFRVKLIDVKTCVKLCMVKPGKRKHH